jgi:hypothetical protein
MKNFAEAKPAGSRKEYWRPPTPKASKLEKC